MKKLEKNNIFKIFMNVTHSLIVQNFANEKEKKYFVYFVENLFLLIVIMHCHSPERETDSRSAIQTASR